MIKCMHKKRIPPHMVDQYRYPHSRSPHQRRSEKFCNCEKSEYDGRKRKRKQKTL